MVASLRRLKRACKRASRALAPSQTFERIAERRCPETVCAHYGDITVRSMARVLRRMGPIEELLDLGCGVGRWLLVASRRLGVARCAGIGTSPSASPWLGRPSRRRSCCTRRHLPWSPWLRPTHVVCYDLMFGDELREKVTGAIAGCSSVVSPPCGPRRPSSPASQSWTGSRPTRRPATYLCFIWRRQA